MWMFLLIVSLLDQVQAAPLLGQHDGLQFLLQDQLDQTGPTPTPDVAQQRTSSSSSSSSSSSESSESSQSSEDRQQLRQQQNLENTAVEQVDSSQESSEVVQPPSDSNSSLWTNQLVLLGDRAGLRDGDGDIGDDSTESRHRVLLLTYHHLLSQPRHRETGVTAEVGGAVTDVGVAAGGLSAAAREEGGVKEEQTDAEFLQLPDNSAEGADELTFDLPGHGYHRDEAGLELGL